MPYFLLAEEEPVLSQVPLAVEKLSFLKLSANLVIRTVLFTLDVAKEVMKWLKYFMTFQD
jgi:hypothetical protein